MDPHSLTEHELDSALQRLIDLQARARANLAAQGRDPDAARVLIETWREALAAQRILGARARRLLTECEQRGLVRFDGPFVAIIDARGAGRQGSAAARSFLELAA